MRLEENHKFLVLETPRSALFFNHVTSGFACPTQNKKISPQHWRIQWIQVSSYSHALPCSHMESTVFSPKLECDLWRMVVIFKFNKNTSIKCNRNLTLLYKFQQKSTTPITINGEATRQCQILILLAFQRIEENFINTSHLKTQPES